DQRGADEQDQHRQEAVPWRLSMNRLAQRLAEVVRDDVADDGRTDRGELPSKSFDGTKKCGPDQDHQHDNVICFHACRLRAAGSITLTTIPAGESSNCSFGREDQKWRPVARVCMSAFATAQNSEN